MMTLSDRFSNESMPAGQAVADDATPCGCYLTAGSGP